MKFIVTADGADKGTVYDVTVLAKKFNGVWTKWRTSVGFVPYSGIRILEMTDAEAQMAIYMEPGYPGKVF